MPLPPCAAQLLPASGERVREAALASPVFVALTELMSIQCHAGVFNSQVLQLPAGLPSARLAGWSVTAGAAPVATPLLPALQSTANAWWAVAKLCAPERPASGALVGALEGALIACLSAGREADRPNAQAVSSVWYRHACTVWLAHV